MVDLMAMLEAGLIYYDLFLNEQQKQQLINYILLLDKWNKAYNLTGFKTPIEMLNLHILDTLAILRYIKVGPILDVGTGAGVPGIPLAISCPDLNFTLLDKCNKKLQFVRYAALQLGLKNVTVLQGRVQDLKIENCGYKDGFAVIIARAVMRMQELAEQSAHLCQTSGTIMAMKARMVAEEVKEVDLLWDVKVNWYQLHELDAKRCLVCLTKIV